EDVEADVVADRHLVEGAAEVGLHHRELLQQPVALRLQVLVLGRRRGGVRLLLGFRRRAPGPLAEFPGNPRLDHGSTPEGAGALPPSPPTTITSGRFCCALM